MSKIQKFLGELKDVFTNEKYYQIVKRLENTRFFGIVNEVGEFEFGRRCSEYETVISKVEVKYDTCSIEYLQSALTTQKARLQELENEENFMENHKERGQLSLNIQRLISYIRIRKMLESLNYGISTFRSDVVFVSNQYRLKVQEYKNPLAMGIR